MTYRPDMRRARTAAVFLAGAATATAIIYSALFKAVFDAYRDTTSTEPRRSPHDAIPAPHYGPPHDNAIPAPFYDPDPLMAIRFDPRSGETRRARDSKLMFPHQPPPPGDTPHE